MSNVLAPNKFEIQFRRTGEDEYTGALLVDGMVMGVGAPKTLDEITAFLLHNKFKLGHFRPENGEQAIS